MTYVNIDPPSRTLSPVADALAFPLMNIYNTVLRGGKWPSVWKGEEVTVIPKTQAPTTLNDLRNLSCTSIFSKLLEHFFMKKLRGEVCLSDDQYGAVPGCGATHMITEMNTAMNEMIARPDSAVAIMSIDFKKAFNRMNHSVCLRALAAKGASSQTLRVCHSFLSDRKMRIKMGSSYSTTRNMPGGAPQGTCSGSFLFACTVDGIESPSYLETLGLRQPTQTEHHETSADDVGISSTLGLTDIATRLNTSTDYAINRERRLRRNYTNRLDSSLDTIRWPTSKICQELGARPLPDALWHAKYVDDFTVMEELRVNTAVSHISSSKEIKYLHAEKLQAVMQTVKENTAAIGMLVNPEKTQLVCVSASTQYDVRAYIQDGQTRKKSTDKLKILGYTITSKGNPSEHVAEIRRNYGRKVWYLRHLKRVGIDNTTLITIYKTCLRPLLEYASPAFSSMMTASNVMTLENLQLLALRVVLGYKIGAQECLQQAGVTTVEERMRDLRISFALKTYTNLRFSQKWFPPREHSGHYLRTTNRILETKASTERLKNSPLYAMRRELNTLEDLPPRPQNETDRDESFF